MSVPSLELSEKSLLLYGLQIVKLLMLLEVLAIVWDVEVI